MNEQYSDSWLRGGLRNSDHTEDPITGSVWIRRHRHRDRTNSQRDRETVLERQTPSSLFFTREFPVKAREQNPQNLF